ncbi:MAG: RNA-binding protein [Proteobacteria bacterium]|jgi:RNA recognition motif-containing protein|nr:RNA-binding protein [Pseudomonadota bacterium]
MSQKIYVGNLGFSVNNEDLKAKFEHYGSVSSANVIMDRDSGRSKGFGFVEMNEKSDAMTAISELNGSDFQGRQMNVSEAKPQAPRESRGSRY